jgi:hypothetical protein
MEQVGEERALGLEADLEKPRMLDSARVAAAASWRDRRPQLRQCGNRPVPPGWQSAKQAEIVVMAVSALRTPANGSRMPRGIQMLLMSG